MSIQELRTEKERTLFTVCLVVSCLFWAGLVLGTLGLGLFYVASGAAFMLMTQALFLAGVKGNGVKITPEQFPELHARLEKAAQKLELPVVPEAYLLNHRGMFNAFATNFLGRNFVILYADLLEACGEDDGSIDFIIGHEVGHLAFGHLKFMPVLLPSRFVPLLGAAYSRACEYSCDRAGTVAAGRSEGAVRGLAVLAAGPRYAKRLNVDAFLKQRLETGNFWMGVVELALSHPFLSKRVGAILGDTRPEVSVPHVPRNPFSYVVSPMLAGGGVGGGMVVAVAVVGMMAAIAVPAVMKYREASSAAAMKTYHADDFAKDLDSDKGNEGRDFDLENRLQKEAREATEAALKAQAIQAAQARDEDDEEEEEVVEKPVQRPVERQVVQQRPVQRERTVVREQRPQPKKRVSTPPPKSNNRSSSRIDY